jgi:hypothetical protein
MRMFASAAGAARVPIFSAVCEYTAGTADTGFVRAISAADTHARQWYRIGLVSSAAGSVRGEGWCRIALPHCGIDAELTTNIRITGRSVGCSIGRTGGVASGSYCARLNAAGRGAVQRAHFTRADDFVQTDGCAQADGVTRAADRLQTDDRLQARSMGIGFGDGD